jgi:hypothetical protein
MRQDAALEKGVKLGLPTQPASRITELLPNQWQPITSA